MRSSTLERTLLFPDFLCNQVAFQALTVHLGITVTLSPMYSSDHAQIISVPSLFLQFSLDWSREPNASVVSHDEFSSGCCDAQVHAVLQHAHGLSERSFGTSSLPQDTLREHYFLHFRRLAFVVSAKVGHSLISIFAFFCFLFLFHRNWDLVELSFRGERLSAPTNAGSVTIEQLYGCRLQRTNMSKREHNATATLFWTRLGVQEVQE